MILEPCAEKLLTHSKSCTASVYGGSEGAGSKRRLGYSDYVIKASQLAVNATIPESSCIRCSLMQSKLVALFGIE